MGLACRSKHGYYLPLFELGGRNATDPDHITCDFQREGSKRQKIKYVWCLLEKFLRCWASEYSCRCAAFEHKEIVSSF